MAGHASPLSAGTAGVSLSNLAGHEARKEPVESPQGRATIPVAAGQPPRERLEWLQAAGRLLFVAGALLAWLIPAQLPARNPTIVLSLVMYLGYSLAVLALVWRPVGFARGWAPALHLFDLLACSWLTTITEGTPNSFFISFVFLLIGGTWRWQMWGALVTGALGIATLSLLTWVLIARFDASPALFDTLPSRCTQLAILAGLLGYFGAYQNRFHREIAHLSAWPRRIPEDRLEVVKEVLSQCAQILDTPRVLLVWEEPGDRHVNLAWTSSTGAVGWSQEPEGTYASLVVPRLERASFQAVDAARDRRVVYRISTGFRQCECRPVTEALRARFDVTAVQSWPLEGELTHGRLFSLDKRHMEIDELTVGALVARLAASRLDGLYMVQDIRQAAALRERVRLASDLHDSLLQSLAGTGLQLMVARRLVDRDRERATRKLDEIQTQIEQGELELRTVIRRLRPNLVMASERTASGLEERLRNLGKRIERQWNVKLRYQLDAPADQWRDEFADEVFRIVREGVLNAARHADASFITVKVSASGSVLELDIADDGRGFPFQGTYDLRTLERLNQGPWSMKERVAGLLGDLVLTSTDSGSRLLITLETQVKAG
ncbi:MAG TPA: sensor histidine kinase [Vicinamibacterales bacterium]|nr:sensor histidine kinase [Vicinamibacterales bacterium]